MVGIYADEGFIDYSGGIYNGCPYYSYRFLNHAVLLVGYNDTTKSWLIKNEWGKDWGESGYIRVSYANDCGLTSIVGFVDFTSENEDPRVTVSSSLLYYTNYSLNSNH